MCQCRQAGFTGEGGEQGLFGDEGTGRAPAAMLAHLKRKSSLHLLNEQPFLFGYVYFRQRRDPENPRGFMQKSLVLISPLPCLELFEKVAKMVGQLYFDFGESTVEAACENICSWPAPQPGAQVTLPLVGHMLETTLPCFASPTADSILDNAGPARFRFNRRESSGSTQSARSNGKHPLLTRNSSAAGDTSGNSAGPARHPLTLKASSRSSSVSSIPGSPKQGPTVGGSGSNRSGAPHPLTLKKTPRSSPASSLPGSPKHGPTVAAAAAAVSAAAAEEAAAAAASTSAALSTLLKRHHQGTDGWFQGVNIFREFRHMTHNLWYMWELVITGQPILVVTKNASISSNTVLGLVSLVSPLIYRGDYRPYFTIYDPDCQHFSGIHDASPSTIPAVILGVTNPFFLKMLENWPHILCVGRSEHVLQKDESILSRAASSGDAGALENGGQDAGGLTRSTSASAARTVVAVSSKPKRTKPKLSKRVKEKYLTRPAERPSTLVSRGVPLLAPDESTLKKLLQPASNGGEQDRENQNAIDDINNAVLRRYFRGLTLAFLEPFRPFMSVDTTDYHRRRSRWNPYLEAPTLEKFSEDAFIAKLNSMSSSDVRALGLPLTGSSSSTRLASLVSLYTRFIRSPNFFPWLSHRREEAEITVKAMVAEAVKRLARKRGAPLLPLLDGLRVSQALEMFKRAQQAVNSMLSLSGHVDAELCEAYRIHISVIKSVLPANFQSATTHGQKLSVQAAAPRAARRQSSGGRHRLAGTSSPEDVIAQGHSKFRLKLRENHF